VVGSADFAISCRDIDRHVVSLRKKIEDAPNEPRYSIRAGKWADVSIAELIHFMQFPFMKFCVMKF
jgi:hypothetical protein